MNKKIRDLYKAVLKYGWTVKVSDRKEDGIIQFELLKNMPGEFYSGTRAYTKERVFYLYPPNPYVGRFVEDSNDHGIPLH